MTDRTASNSDARKRREERVGTIAGHPVIASTSLDPDYVRGPDHQALDSPHDRLAEWYHTTNGPLIREGDQVTVSFTGTYLGYDPELGYHHIKGHWVGVEHLPDHEETFHWATHFINHDNQEG